MRLDDIPQINHLNLPEKILLLEDLWDSIAVEENGMSIPEKHMSELDRRWEKYAASPTKAGCPDCSGGEEGMRAEGWKELREWTASAGMPPVARSARR